MVLAVDPANGATLCYGCHIGRIHGDGDGDFVLRLAETMQGIVGAEKVSEMREAAKTHGPLSLEWWEGAEKNLRDSWGIQTHTGNPGGMG